MRELDSFIASNEVIRQRLDVKSRIEGMRSKYEQNLSNSYALISSRNKATAINYTQTLPSSPKRFYESYQRGAELNQGWDSGKYAINTNFVNMDLHQTGSKVMTDSKFDLDAYKLELEKGAAMKGLKTHRVSGVSYTTPTNHFDLNVHQSSQNLYGGNAEVTNYQAMTGGSDMK